MRKTTHVLFDSECRKSCGITDIRFGFLDLLEFDDLSDIGRNTEESYGVGNRDYPPHRCYRF